MLPGIPENPVRRGIHIRSASASPVSFKSTYRCESPADRRASPLPTPPCIPEPMLSGKEPLQATGRLRIQRLAGPWIFAVDFGMPSDAEFRILTDEEIDEILGRLRQDQEDLDEKLPAEMSMNHPEYDIPVWIPTYDELFEMFYQSGQDQKELVDNSLSGLYMNGLDYSVSDGTQMPRDEEMVETFGQSGQDQTYSFENYFSETFMYEPEYYISVDPQIAMDEETGDVFGQSGQDLEEFIENYLSETHMNDLDYEM